MHEVAECNIHLSVCDKVGQTGSLGWVKRVARCAAQAHSSPRQAKHRNMGMETFFFVNTQLYECLSQCQDSHVM